MQYGSGCIAAVIVAAGNASRMNGIDKQRAMLGGIPVLARSAMAFENCAEIDRIVVVCRAGEKAEIAKLMQGWGIKKLHAVAEGGETRQASVFKGILACGEAEYYAIHDGARPLVSGKVICTCIQNAKKYKAATAGVKVKDTIKIVDSSGFIKTTPNRSELYITQTPQIFEAKLYLQAMDNALVENKDYTDDCQLVESIGHKVFMSPSDYTNIKITTPEDLKIAEALLKLD